MADTALDRPTSTRRREFPTRNSEITHYRQLIQLSTINYGFARIS